MYVHPRGRRRPVGCRAYRLRVRDCWRKQWKVDLAAQVRDRFKLLRIPHLFGLSPQQLFAIDPAARWTHRVTPQHFGL